MTARARCAAAIPAMLALLAGGRAGAASEGRSPLQDAARTARNAPAAHLRVEGTRFVQADGKPFHWRGITAFRLLQMLARGRGPEVEEYLDWCAEQGLTVVRVLTMAEHLFPLEPHDGRAALPRLLTLAAARGLYVEIVALADTAVVPVDIDEHVREVGAIAARHGNAIVELANEPGHPTQAERVDDASELAKLARLIPESVPVAFGSAEGDERFAGGDYATFHFPRLDGNRGWDHVAELAEGADLLRKWKKPLVSDEPIGAGDRDDPGARDDSPERFRAAALVSAMVGMGATFHYEDGLHARIPGGRQRAIFAAWREAWPLVPGDGTVTLSQVGGAGSPVQAVNGEFIGAYAAVRGGEAWLLVIGTRGEVEVTWAAGWRPAEKRAWKESFLWPASRGR
jgi:hypothetical protein